jgi:hypothetical protein
MTAPTKEEIKELWAVHTGPEATAERERRANAFDDTRSWVDPNGYRLSDRVWRQRAEIRSQIDAVLREAIRTGEDALLTAKKLEQYLDPKYAPVRTEKGRLKRNQARSIVTTAPGRGGSGSFPARRLARTEITRAHGQATIWTAERTPFAKGVKWNLSGRHPKADECDRNASQDSGLGRGVYKTSEVPRYPSHPQDLCSLSVSVEEDTDKIVKQLREQYGLDEVTTHQGNTTDLFEMPKGAFGERLRTGTRAIDSVHATPGLPPIRVRGMQRGDTLGQYDFNINTGAPKGIGVQRNIADAEWAMVHETGHYIDHQILGKQGLFTSVNRSTGIAEEFRTVASDSRAIRNLIDARVKGDVSVTLSSGDIVTYEVDHEYVRYLLDETEVFARAYTQYIARKSGDPTLLKQLDGIRSGVGNVYQEQWDDDDFAPIEAAIDNMFRKKGWIP